MAVHEKRRTKEEGERQNNSVKGNLEEKMLERELECRIRDCVRRSESTGGNQK